MGVDSTDATCHLTHLWSTCIDVCHTWTTACLASQLHRPMCVSFKLINGHIWAKLGLRLFVVVQYAHTILLRFTRRMYAPRQICGHIDNKEFENLNYIEGENCRALRRRLIQILHSHGQTIIIPPLAVATQALHSTTAVCFRKSCDNAETWPPPTNFASTTITETSRRFRRPTAHPY